VSADVVGLTPGTVRGLLRRHARERVRNMRAVARMFGVPTWIVGAGKRPPQPKVAGQRGTGHHRPHRRP